MRSKSRKAPCEDSERHVTRFNRQAFLTVGPGFVLDGYGRGTKRYLQMDRLARSSGQRLCQPGEESSFTIRPAWELHDAALASQPPRATPGWLPYLCEIKRAIDVETDTVQKKAKAATEWCERASAVSDRQWKYVLLSHDSILINRTFASLVQH